MVKIFLIYLVHNIAGKTFEYFFFLLGTMSAVNLKDVRHFFSAEIYYSLVYFCFK